jgi:hypothetical protein
MLLGKLMPSMVSISLDSSLTVCNIDGKIGRSMLATCVFLEP